MKHILFFCILSIFVSGCSTTHTLDMVMKHCIADPSGSKDVTPNGARSARTGYPIVCDVAATYGN